VTCIPIPAKHTISTIEGHLLLCNLAVITNSCQMTSAFSVRSVPRSYKRSHSQEIEERGLLNASQFGFRASHSTTLQCMRLTDHVTLNFNNKMSTAAVFLDSEKAFDTTWHPGLLYKLSKLEFPTNLIKLLGSFLSHRKFRVSVEGEMSTPREMQAGVPQGSVLSLTLFNLYINDAPPNTWCTPSSLCGRHLSICDRPQGGLHC
jgi:hypothetical protein